MTSYFPRQRTGVRRLEQVTEAGESEGTPWIALGGVWIVCAVLVVIVLAVTAIAAYFLS